MDILQQLSTIAATQETQLDSWFSEHRMKTPPHLTTSVDLRHSGLRLVPVDTNIYPAGFQNLSENGAHRAASHMKSGICARAPHAKKVLIIPENHTRNLPYLDNLKALTRILELEGFEVAIGSLMANYGESLTLAAESGDTVVQASLKLVHNRLVTHDGFDADAIVLNNDGTAGIHPLLQAAGQPVLPSAEYGWFQRRKSCHFTAYDAISQHFALAFGIDHWRISAYFDAARGVDFKSRQGVDALARKVDALIQKIAVKHTQYGMKEPPFVYVKADSGTYGMGIMVVHDGSELLEMNKKQRNKMHVIKEGAEVHDVILQEGVKTVDTVDGSAAEPMVYLVDGVPVGGMFRINSQRDNTSNLNAAGMSYVGMCDAGEEDAKALHPVQGCDFSAYGIIGAMAALAAGAERYLDRCQLSAASGQ